MDRKLTAKEYLLLASMLFGLFFGAGNLIFPVHMGQQAGSALWPACVGFCLTGVGLPLLGIAAMGISRSDGMFQMAEKVGRRYSYFFTCALYLSIGPLFAIPRTATVSFSTGIQPLLPEGTAGPALCLFSAVFFLLVLYFSLRPSGILTWVGKILNPLFLLFLAALTLTALFRPMGDVSALAPTETYASAPFFQGLLDGYNTLDALASLAFGIILIDAIRGLGVSSPRKISADTIRAGLAAGESFAKALRTRHLKRRLAWSTVSNLSYILLGVTAMTSGGLAAALLHMVVHAVLKITLFFGVGAVHFKLHYEGFIVVRSHLFYKCIFYIGNPFALQFFLKSRLIIIYDILTMFCIVYGFFKKIQHYSLHFLKSTVYIYCSYNCFHCVRKDRFPCASSALFFSVTQSHIFAESKLSCFLCQGFFTN